MCRRRRDGIRNEVKSQRWLGTPGLSTIRGILSAFDVESRVSRSPVVQCSLVSCLCVRDHPSLCFLDFPDVVDGTSQRSMTW